MPESGPLSGKSVVVTRAAAQAAGLARALEEAGAKAVLLPMIEFAPPDSWDSLDALIDDPLRFDWIVFTSTNGVRAFFQRVASRGMDAAAPLAGCTVAAVGAATAAELRNSGVDPDAVPEAYRAAALVPLLTGGTRRRVAIVRAAAGKDDLIDALRERGVTVDLGIAYQTRAVDESRDELRRLAALDAIDCVTFTSGSTVESFVSKLDQRETARLLARAAFVSIGPSTSETMRSLRIPVTAEAANASVEAITAAVIQALR